VRVGVVDVKVFYLNRRVLYWVIVGVVAVVLLILLLTGGKGGEPPAYPTMGDGVCRICGIC
jgi:hypothetical protein